MATQSVSSYGNSTVSGSAQVHQGDNITYNYYPWSQQFDKYSILYKSLTFDRIDSRFRSIELALSQTCEWVYSNESFIAWTDHHRIDEHHGLLWFKGKPGSGKSTIMKKLLEWARGTWKDEVILFYFFDGRATGELERSCLGLYRSLLYQLLSLLENIRPLFVKEFSSKEGNGHVEEDWTEVELKNFILSLIKSAHLTTLNIFVDALDEGDEQGVQDMLLFFEEMASYSIQTGSTFRLCLSSRHYPQIIIETGLSIIVENQPGHMRDIEIYIERTLPGKNQASMNEIRRTLLRRSEHVFLWVVLSVSLLKPLYHKGRVKEMRTRLDKIPIYLNDLFSKIITRNAEYLEECVTLLQWMLVSQRPLTAIELYLAIQARHDASSLEDFDDLDQIANYILDCARGLVELTTTPDAQVLVQFIHETVRQFLLSTAKDFAFPDQSPAMTIEFRQEICHAAAAEGCLEYLLHVCRKAPLNAEELQRLPLAKYAARYWGSHMRAATFSSNSKLLELAITLLLKDPTNLLAWTHIYNIDDEQDPEQEFCNFHLTSTDLAPPLYYASLIGSPELVRNIVSRKVNVNAQGGLYETALFAASNKGYDEVVEILLDNGADANVQGEDGETALYAASIHGHKKVVHTLLEKGADVNAQGGEFNSALQAASAAGDEAVVQTLLDHGADVNSQGGFYGNALSTAAALGHKHVVKTLLPALIPTLRDKDKIERLSSIFMDGGWTDLRSARSKVNEPLLSLGIMLLELAYAKPMVEID